MKLYLGFALLLLSTFIGYRLSVKYSYRKKFYDDFCFFNRRVKEEMLFSRKSLLSILNESGRAGVFYDGTKKYFYDNKEPIDSKPLKKEDGEIWREYLEFLGETDAKSQLDKISSVETVLTGRLKECESEEKKYKNLYVKFGFLIGLALFIVVL